MRTVNGQVFGNSAPLSRKILTPVVAFVLYFRYAKELVQNISCLKPATCVVVSN